MRKLVIVEGLPGSGKSTTADVLAKAMNMRCFDENSGDHPADYEFHAYLTDVEMRSFDEAERAVIQARGISACGGWVVPLCDFEGALFERLLKRKIYDFLPWESERPVMLDKWRRFAEEAAREETGCVFNCVLLQNPMCETMMRFNFDISVSAAYIGEIADIIRPLKPFIVYLDSDDIRADIDRCLPERGSEWLSAVIDYHCGGAYGNAHHLAGFEGYLSALKERRRRELEILKNLGLDHLILRNAQSDWNSSYRRIMEELNRA